MEKSFLGIARGVSGYRDSDMASIIGLDIRAYREIEREPDSVSLHMLKLLLPNVNRFSVRIIHDAIDDIFLPYE
ncbi:MAG: hypothetical protein ACLSVD_08200 [Eggerthellaceae bacterium]